MFIKLAHEHTSQLERLDCGFNDDNSKRRAFKEGSLFSVYTSLSYGSFFIEELNQISLALTRTSRNTR